MHATTTTPEVQFTDALRQVENAGVRVEFNVDSCCRGCAQAGQLSDLHNYVWTFAGQGHELVWDEDGQPFNREVEEHDCTCEDAEFDEDGEGEDYECDVCAGYTESETETLTPAAFEWFYFDTCEAATALVTAMRAHGFTVEWDGSLVEAVTVRF